MESRYYPGVEADVIKLTTELRDLFDQDFDVQTMEVSSTAVLQARKSSTLREITGLSAALTIKITPETGGTRVLNTLLLFLVALEPYLFNNLGDFFIGVQQSGSLQNVASTVYALDIGTIYGILAMFANILAIEERKLVAPDLLRKYKFSRNLEIIVAVLFLVSAILEFWTLNLRYFIWATTFFVFRGGNIVNGRRKLSHSS